MSDPDDPDEDPGRLEKISPDVVQNQDSAQGFLVQIADKPGRPIESLGGPKEKTLSYDAEKQHDWVRLLLVFGLLLILGVLVVGTFLGLSNENANTQKNLIQVVGRFVAPVTTLIGAATGFYFGKEAANKGETRATSNPPPPQPSKKPSRLKSLFK